MKTKQNTKNNSLDISRYVKKTSPAVEPFKRGSKKDLNKEPRSVNFLKSTLIILDVNNINRSELINTLLLEYIEKNKTFLKGA